MSDFVHVSTCWIVDVKKVFGEMFIRKLTWFSSKGNSLGN